MTVFQKFCYIHKTNMAGIAIAILFALGQTAQAKTIITLDDNLAISILSGQLDTRRYQGEIFDVELLEDGVLVALADRVLLKTEGSFDEPNLVIRQFEVDNLEAVDDSLFLTAQTIRVRDLHLGWLSDDTPSTTVNSVDWQQAFYQMENIEIIDENSGYALAIPRFETMPLEFGQLSDGTAFLASGGFEMPYMQILPFGDSPSAIEFETWLNTAGLPYLEFAFIAQQKNSIQDAEIISDSEMQMRMAGLFDLLIHTKFYTSEDAFLLLSDTDMWRDEAETYLSYLVAETKLGSFKINMRDLGLLAFIDQTGELPPYPILAEQMKGIMGSFLPETGPELARAIESFMIDGGALQLSATPNTPFRIEDFAAALFMPDFVMRQINLNAIHTP